MMVCLCGWCDDCGKEERRRQVIQKWLQSRRGEMENVLLSIARSHSHDTIRCFFFYYFRSLIPLCECMFNAFILYLRTLTQHAHIHTYIHTNTPFYTTECAKNEQNVNLAAPTTRRYARYICAARALCVLFFCAVRNGVAQTMPVARRRNAKRRPKFICELSALHFIAVLPVPRATQSTQSTVYLKT